MTEMLENEAIAQALEIVDRSLSTLLSRELVSSAEVADVLLDIRSVLAGAVLDELDQLEDAVVSSAN